MNTSAFSLRCLGFSGAASLLGELSAHSPHSLSAPDTGVGLSLTEPIAVCNPSCPSSAGIRLRYDCFSCSPASHCWTSPSMRFFHERLWHARARA